jgi:hypothetical protein
MRGTAALITCAPFGVLDRSAGGERGSGPGAGAEMTREFGIPAVFRHWKTRGPPSRMSSTF